MKFIFYNCFVFLLLFLSCNVPQGKQQIKEEEKEEKKEEIKIINGVINVLNTEKSNLEYSLYLPSDTNLKELPLIFFLDPHGNSNYVISLYQHLSEKYKVVLISTKAIANGKSVGEINNIINEILTECASLVSIDTNSVYIAGFSGMARVSYLLGTNLKRYKGIISIGAGYDKPLPWKDSSFCIIQMAGFKDMNFAETYLSSQIQRNVSLLYTGFFYDNDHSWPVDTVLEYPLLCFFASRFPKYKDQFFNNWCNYLKKIPVRDEWKKALYVQSLYNLCLITKYYGKNFNELNNFLNLYKTKKLLKDFKEFLKQEQVEQQNIIKNIIEKDTLWWQKYIGILTTITKKELLSPKDYKDIRILNYISLVSYSMANNFLSQNDFLNAYKILKIYREADPSNADMFYMWSVYWAKLNNAAKSLYYLEEAVKFGFNNLLKIQAESSFVYLRNNQKFNEIVEKIKKR
ncbi:MAG: hypothetical protein N3A01_05655 [Bacteroidales bacterium]|nr:hypothetical protein [Bacteroidales bacterium]